MMTNDETQLMSGRQVANQQKENANARGGQSLKKEHKGSWKKITLGAVSGILVGAGAMYAANAFGVEGGNGEQGETSQPENVKVAKVDDDLSFQDAFDAARAQVGPGGVFRWNGGLYSTYKEDEWNAMSDDDKAEFAQAVRPEVRADEIVAERMSEAQPQVVVIKERVVATEPQQTSQQTDGDVQMAHNAVDNDAVQHTNSQQQDDNDGDVHVVGQGYVQGHQAVALDLTGNGEADVAIIDVNDNGQLDDPDVVVDREGNYATMGQIAQAQTGQGMDNGNDYAADNQTANDPTWQQTGYEDSVDTNDSTGLDDTGVVDDGSLNTLM